MNQSPQKRGILFIVSSPSGAGKTTLCHRLMKEYKDISFSISFTTRPRRSNEREGIDYHFVDEKKFAEMVTNNAFAEWARVHDHRYGTARSTIEKNLVAGKDILFDIDWQGATRLKSQYPEDTVMVFVLPPNMTELAKRLWKRGTDAKEVVERRLAVAKEELGHYGEYHYLIRNENLEHAYIDLKSIYHAAHLTQQRQAHLALHLLEEVRIATD